MLYSAIARGEARKRPRIAIASRAALHKYDGGGESGGAPPVAEDFVFEAIKEFVADLAGGERQGVQLDVDDLRLATAALLVHAASADGEISKAGYDRLLDLLRQRFVLDAVAARELIDRATAADEKAVDLYHFTRLLKDMLDDTGRLRVIEMMWSIAYADGTLSDYESHLIWRVADLLVVPATERIASRNRATAAAKGGA